jgi:hypothetical protein
MAVNQADCYTQMMPRAPRLSPATDLVGRNVHAKAPNMPRAADITHAPTWTG